MKKVYTLIATAILLVVTIALAKTPRTESPVVKTEIGVPSLLAVGFSFYYIPAMTNEVVRPYPKTKAIGEESAGFPEEVFHPPVFI